VNGVGVNGEGVNGVGVNGVGVNGVGVNGVGVNGVGVIGRSRAALDARSLLAPSARPPAPLPPCTIGADYRVRHADAIARDHRRAGALRPPARVACPFRGGSGPWVRVASPRNLMCTYLVAVRASRVRHKPVPGEKKTRIPQSTGVRGSRARCSLIENSDCVPVLLYNLERAYWDWMSGVRGRFDVCAGGGGLPDCGRGG
jgi:hypothetical protein